MLVLKLPAPLFILYYWFFSFPFSPLKPFQPTTPAKFCDECGAPYLRETSKFCSECGVKRLGIWFLHNCVAFVGTHTLCFENGVRVVDWPEIYGTKGHGHAQHWKMEEMEFFKIWFFGYWRFVLHPMKVLFSNFLIQWKKSRSCILAKGLQLMQKNMSLEDGCSFCFVFSGIIPF